jgi:hypothetical protein
LPFRNLLTEQAPRTRLPNSLINFLGLPSSSRAAGPAEHGK